MDGVLVISFIGATILLALMPGPDVLFVLTESITKGAKTGRTIAMGLVSGVLIHTALAATGLSLIIEQSDVVYSIIKYLGAAYLLYLAFQASREKPIMLEIDRKQESNRFQFFKLYRKGFLMNILNPKVSIFFIAFLPQFVTADGWLPMIQMMVLGIIFILFAFIVFVIVAALAGQLAPYLGDEKIWNISKWVKATVFLGLAISLVLH